MMKFIVRLLLGLGCFKHEVEDNKITFLKLHTQFLVHSMGLFISVGKELLSSQTFCFYVFRIVVYIFVKLHLLSYYMALELFLIKLKKIAIFNRLM